MQTVPDKLGIGYKEELQGGKLFIYVDAPARNYTCYFVLSWHRLFKEWHVQDWTHAVTQDFFFDHILEAVAFIINRTEQLK